jgi:HD-GYP domain-containing protein (c-di-GMP phosphodiesterase class II)
MHFLNVPFHLIKIKESFACNLFLFDIRANNRIIAHYAYEDLSEEQYMHLDNLIGKGASLQIVYEDVDLLCQEMECEIAIIEEFNQQFYLMFKKEYNRKLKYAAVVEWPFNLKSLIKSESTLKFLVERVKAEVSLFPLTLSLEISFATEMIEKLFVSDIAIIQEASLTYYLAKLSKINDPEILSSLLLASLFKDIGLTQLPRNLLKEKSYQDDEWYLKHPLLSIYLMAKTNFEFSKLTKRLILEHHELLDGTGFPKQKIENQLEPLSGFIRASFEFMQEKAIRPEISYQQILNQMVQNKNSRGEFLQLPLKVLEALSFLQS